VSVRLELTLSYAGFVMLAGALLLTAVWVFLLRGTPNGIFVPNLSNLSNLLLAFDTTNFGPAIFGPVAAAMLAFPGGRSHRNAAPQAHEGTLTLAPGPREGSVSRCSYPLRHRTRQITRATAYSYVFCIT
jgi:hypothetical protein